MIDSQQLTFLETVETQALGVLTPTLIYDRLDEKLLRLLAEDRRIERKPARYSEAEAGEYVSMWANSSPDGGLLVFGMADKGTFEGLTAVGEAKVNRLEKVGKTYCPDAVFKTKRIAVTNAKGQNDFVLACRIPYHAARVVKTTKGEAFTRRGDSKFKLSAEEMRELQQDKKEVHIELEDCQLKYPEDFDRQTIKNFTDRVRRERQIDDSRSDEDVLRMMRLGQLDDNGAFRPNVACALLFATDPRMVIPGSQIHFLRFEGDKEGTGERWNATKEEFFEGRIGELIARTGTFIHSQVRTFSHLGPNGKFFTKPEYPVTAWWEALVNACVHRSYGDGLKNTPIFIKMFDSRLTIESPGPFPPFVTAENIYQQHRPRNPFLMEAMRYLEYVKCANEGTRRMRESMKEMQLPEPEFRQEVVGHATVRVTLLNNVQQRRVWVDQDVAEMVGSMVAKSLNEDEKRFLNFIAEHSEISVTEAQRLTNGRTWHFSKKILEGLVNRAILVRHKRPGVERDALARYRLNKVP